MIFRATGASTMLDTSNAHGRGARATNFAETLSIIGRQILLDRATNESDINWSRLNVP